MAKQRRSPKIDVEITDDLWDTAVASNSGGCLISDALMRQHPQFTSATTDMATIRFTDREAGVRYTYLTPPEAQHILLAFDQEWDKRYTAIKLESYGGTSPAVQGHAYANTASLWSRYRAPTGLTALDRPVRYVLEYAYTAYLGDQAGILGFSHLHSVGLGLELDSSAHDIFITRTRLVGRYMFGNNVSGFSVGMAVSF